MPRDVVIGYLRVAIQISACVHLKSCLFVHGCLEPGGSLMYAIPPAGQLSGPKGEGLFLSIKRALHMPCTGDRWSLMLQLTSNLASVIIKPSFLDVTLCSQQSPTPTPHPTLLKKIPFFWQKKLKWDFLGMCVWGAGRKMGSRGSRCSRMFLKNWGFVISAGGDWSNLSCHHWSAFLFQNWIIYSFFSLLFVLLSCSVDLNFTCYVIQPWSRPKRTGLLFYRVL